MGDITLTEQIIKTIKQYPVLYDNTRRRRRDAQDSKEKLWGEIAESFDLNVHVLKVKWKNLRDCYKRHVRAQYDDSKTVSSYKNWQWSEYLEFLRPYILSHKEVVYCNATNDEQSMKYKSGNKHNIKQEENENDMNFGSDSEAAESVGSEQDNLMKIAHSENCSSDPANFEYLAEEPNWKKRRTISSSNINPTESQNSKADLRGFDDIELIFLGYAKTVKKMPLKRQISAKMKIAKIIMEEELKCLE